MTVGSENTQNLIKRGDATSSWSGFNYQGNITIYAAICLLNKIGNNIDEIEKYEIEIEKHEDFSILYDTKIISLHQVKSYQNKNSITGYNGALIELFAKAIEFPTVQEISLHTASEIDSFNESDLIKSLKDYLPSSISENKKTIYKETKEKLFDQNLFKDYYSILKLNNFSSDIVSLERFLLIDEVSLKIALELQRFYSDYHPSKHLYENPEQYKFAYLNILSKLNDKITKIHSKAETKYTFKLKDLYEIIFNQNIFNCTSETVRNLLLKELNTLFELYLEDHPTEEVREKEIIGLWSKHREVLEKLTSEDLILLCKRLSPEIDGIPIEFSNIETYRNLLHPQGVSEMLFYSLFELTNKIAQGECVKTHFTLKDDDIHLITLIYHNNVSMVGRKIINNLSRDRNLYDLLFDNKFYLTKNINDVFSGKRADAEFDVFSTNGTRKREKFMLPKQLHFKSRDTISGR